MTTDERLDRIEQSIQNLAQSTESKFQNLERLIGKVTQSSETNFQNLNRYVLELRTETINRFEIIDNRLSLLAATYQSVEARMAPLTKAILDFGAIANRLQIEQSRLAKLVEPAA
jgi:prefoldin subunit 5